MRASSNPGDLVADFFCGSGTTPLVTARLQRHFIAVDSQRRAVHTTRRRLAAAGAAPFQMETAGDLQLEPDRAEATELDLVAGHAYIRHAGSDLEYWELDPAWDGVTFRSAAQAFRAQRSDWLPDHLPMIVMRGEQPVCVRYVLSNGGEGQLTAATG